LILIILTARVGGALYIGIYRGWVYNWVGYVHLRAHNIFGSDTSLRNMKGEERPDIPSDLSRFF